MSRCAVVNHMVQDKPPVVPIDMRPTMSELAIMWRCLKCGEMWHDRGDPLPEQCPNCGAPKTEFELVQED